MSNVVYTNLSNAHENYQELIDEAAQAYAGMNYEKREYISLMRQFFRDRYRASPQNYLDMARRDFVFYLYSEYSEEDISHWLFNHALKVEHESLFVVHAYLVWREENGVSPPF